VGERVKILINNLMLGFSKDGITLIDGKKELFHFKYTLISQPYFSLIILAAGEENLVRVRSIIETYSKIPVIRETVVVGNEKQLLEEIPDLLDVKFTINRIPFDPIATSLKKAISLLNSHSEFGIMFFANRDIFPIEEMNKLMHTVYRKKINVAVPVKNGKRTHPVVFSRDALGKIKRIRKEQGVKYFIKNFGEEVAL